MGSRQSGIDVKIAPAREQHARPARRRRDIEMAQMRLYQRAQQRLDNEVWHHRPEIIGQAWDAIAKIAAERFQRWPAVPSGKAPQPTRAGQNGARTLAVNPGHARGVAPQRFGHPLIRPARYFLSRFQPAKHLPPGAHALIFGPFGCGRCYGTAAPGATWSATTCRINIVNCSKHCPCSSLAVWIRPGACGLPF